MARYFFHTQDGKCILDDEGTELPSFEAAKREAVQLLCETFRNRADLFWETGKWTITVADEGGLTLFTLDLMASMAAASPERPRRSAG